MKRIDFKRIIAKNFLCFGDKPFDITFNQYGNILLVKGTNLDSCRKGEEARLSSNGSGKSSIPEIIVYGLFGKTIKSPKKIGHKEVMHIGASKNLSVEVFWDDYKLERKRKPDSLKLWKSEDGKFDDTTELTLGGMPATQKLIEDIIGLNYQTFLNIFIFTDDNSVSFLECDAAEKRTIVENLLSLEKYRSFLDVAKQTQKEHSQTIKNLQLECDFISKSIKSHNDNIAIYEQKTKVWKVTKINEVKSMAADVSSAEKELQELSNSQDVQIYEDAQKELAEIMGKLETIIPEKDSIIEQIDPYEKSIRNAKENKSKLDSDKHDIALKKKEYVSTGQKLKEVLQKIDKLEPGVVCDHCFGKVDPSNYGEIKAKHLEEMADIKSKYTALEVDSKNLDVKIAVLDQEIKDHNDKLAKIISQKQQKELEIGKLNRKTDDLRRIKVPDNSVKKAGLEEKIRIIKERTNAILAELKGLSPYDDMLVKEQSQIIEKTEQLNIKNKSLEETGSLAEYYGFWITAFGDTGIRKYVIDEIIPALNDNVNYWLQYLIDNKIKITFDNELNETIIKHPDNKPLNYHILSNGQKRRVNLALSQSFAHVMSLNTGRYPSLVFLDEVTSNIDPVGVEGIYKMICELSKEKQVVITTHDHDLLELLNGCQELHLVMKNGSSYLEKK